MNYLEQRVGELGEEALGEKRAEETLREREAALEAKTKELQEVHSALTVLLKRRNEEARELEKKVLCNLKQLVVPHIGQLKKTGLDTEQMRLLSIIESNLKEITSSFSHKLSSKCLDLTARENQVANLVRVGKTTKQIAELLNVSTNAIVFHRYNIRKKLGLGKQKINLGSYLASMV